MRINKKLESIIHESFIKGNIFGLMDLGFPEDEYQMEESKLYTFLDKNPKATESQIYEELIKIIEDWFGESPLHEETLKTLKQMSKEIYDKKN